MTKQAKTKYLDYLTDPTLNKISKLFVLSSFSKYQTLSVEIKDFNALIDGKSFFGVPIKNKEEAYEANT